MILPHVRRQEESKETSPDKHAEAWNTLEGVDGVVLPGGFGTRGVEGKILTAKLADCSELKTVLHPKFYIKHRTKFVSSVP